MTIKTDFGFRFLSVHQIKLVTKEDNGYLLHLNNEKTENISDNEFNEMSCFQEYPFVRISEKEIKNLWLNHEWYLRLKNAS